MKALRSLLSCVLPVLLAAAAGGPSPARDVEVRILSPRSGAELQPGSDKVTIVVEVEDSSEAGIKLKKGVPVFDTPTLGKESVDQALKQNLDIFLKNLVGVTVYSLPARPGRPSTTVYQLTSVIRISLLSGGCQHPLYPADLKLPESGQSKVLPSGYVKGAAFQFTIQGSAVPEDQGPPSQICIVPPPGMLN